MGEPATREEVGFPSGGVTLAGYLYAPAGDPAAPWPCVVMAHGFTGTMDRLFRYAERFAAAGLAVLLFDYRNFGASGGRPRQLIDIPGQLEDWRSAIAFARAHPQLDARRIAVWGSSLGGGHAVAMASEDPDLAAAVAQIPWLGDGRSTAQKLRQMTQLTTVKLVVAAVRDALRGRRGREPLLVPALGEPGSTAMFTDPRAREALEAKGTDHTLWRNEFAPRIVLELARYEPGAAMHRVRIPLLVCVGEFDAESPVDYAEGVIARAPRGELRRYPGTHFELYHGALYEQVVADQLAFLREHLLGPVAGGRAEGAGGR